MDNSDKKGMQQEEEEEEEPLEDFIQAALRAARAKRRDPLIEKRFRSLIKDAMDRDETNIIVSKREATVHEINYLTTVPGLTVVSVKILHPKWVEGWRIYWK